MTTSVAEIVGYMEAACPKGGLSPQCFIVCINQWNTLKSIKDKQFSAAVEDTDVRMYINTPDKPQVMKCECPFL